MEEQRFATVMWGGFDFIADAGGNDPERREWLMECSGLQASLWTSFVTVTHTVPTPCHAYSTPQHSASRIISCVAITRHA